MARLPTPRAGAVGVKVLLINMPFASVHRPALGLSILKARLAQDGVACEVAYPNLAFARRVGRRRYEHIADGLPFPALAGEWVFAACLGVANHQTGQQADGSYLHDVMLATWRRGTHDLNVLRRARRLAEGFLADYLASVPWADYELVGFTSCCAQNVASLALARRVKELHPGILIVFGGANWEGAMGRELLRRFSFVDYACSGEADLSFPLLVRRLEAAHPAPPADIPGVLYRHGGHVHLSAESGPRIELDALPPSDFSDYYAALTDTGYHREITPGLLVETGRGCWWAAQGPCAFCAQNGASTASRAKTPERMTSELRAVDAAWSGGTVEIVDNLVTPAFLSRALPELAARPLAHPLFFEARPDLSREQVRLAAAAHASVQIGIESLSDHVLRLIHKGSRALENIRLLKWCKTYGVTAYWNLMYGFPEETAADYEDMIALLPSIRFLAPPHSVVRLVLERFSPYWRSPDEHGIRAVRAAAAYRHLYDLADDALGEVAFFFDYDLEQRFDPSQHVARLQDEVHRWRREHTAGVLRCHTTADGSLLLLDSRPGSGHHEIALDPLETLLYRACDDIARGDRLLALARAESRPVPHMEEAVAARLTALVERRLMVAIDDRFLSLALPQEALL